MIHCESLFDHSMIAFRLVPKLLRHHSRK
jgi:hypothetical protein